MKGRGEDGVGSTSRGQYNEGIKNGYQEEPAEGGGSDTWGHDLLCLKQAGISVIDLFSHKFVSRVRID